MNADFNSKNSTPYKSPQVFNKRNGNHVSCFSNEQSQSAAKTSKISKRRFQDASACLASENDHSVQGSQWYGAEKGQSQFNTFGNRFSMTETKDMTQGQA